MPIRKVDILKATTVEYNLTKLKNYPPGPLHGGVSHAVHNQFTKRILQHGLAAIPKLIQLYPRANETQRIFIIFCLGQIGGNEAKKALLNIQKSLGRGPEFADLRANLQEALDRLSR